MLFFYILTIDILEYLQCSLTFNVARRKQYTALESLKRFKRLT